MPRKTLLSLAAASILGLSLAMPAPAKADKLTGWEGFGVGLLAAPLVYGITRPLFGGYYGAPAVVMAAGTPMAMAMVMATDMACQSWVMAFQDTNIAPAVTGPMTPPLALFWAMTAVGTSAGGDFGLPNVNFGRADLPLPGHFACVAGAVWA